MRRPWALAAADGLTHAGLTTPAEIQAYLDPLRRYPGIGSWPVTTRHHLFGSDNAFEREVGAYLGIEPLLRAW